MVKHIFFLFAYVFLLKQDTMNQENEMVECQSKGSYYVWYFWIYTHMYIYIYVFIFTVWYSNIHHMNIIFVLGCFFFYFLWIFLLFFSKKSWQVFRNTSIEFGKHRSNSLPGLPGIQRRLDCSTARHGFLIHFQDVVLGSKTISRTPSILKMTSLFFQDSYSDDEQPTVNSQIFVISWFQVFAVTSGNGHVIVRGESGILINGKSSSLLDVIMLI